MGIWRLLPAVLGIGVPTMMQVGPDDAILNLCKWPRKFWPFLQENCLPGVSPAWLYAIAGILVIAGFAWFAWPYLPIKNKRPAEKNDIRTGGVSMEDRISAKEVAMLARNAMQGAPKLSEMIKGQSDDSLILIFLEFIWGKAGPIWNRFGGSEIEIPTWSRPAVENGEIVVHLPTGDIARNLVMSRTSALRIIEEHREWAFGKGMFRGVIMQDGQDITYENNTGTAGFYGVRGARIANNDFSPARPRKNDNAD